MRRIEKLEKIESNEGTNPWYRLHLREGGEPAAIAVPRVVGVTKALFHQARPGDKLRLVIGPG